MPHHVFGDGGFGNLNAQLELAVNAWSAPQRGLLRLSIRIRSLTSCGMQGRPGLPRWILHVQNKPKPLRWQATTVSALTIIRRISSRSTRVATRPRRFDQRASGACISNTAW